MTQQFGSTTAFDKVAAIGLTLPAVEVTTRYNGAPVLKLHGCFMAGPATHPSAEPDSLVVRASLDERHWLLEDAPDTYYLTDYYRPRPVVLVRLARIGAVALRDLLSMSWQVTQLRSTRRSAPAASAARFDWRNSPKNARLPARARSHRQRVTGGPTGWG